MRIILLAIVLSANSIPSIAQTNDIHNNINVQITEEIKIEDSKHI